MTGGDKNAAGLLENSSICNNEMHLNARPVVSDLEGRNN
jgi:hypothetical protein